MPRQYPVCDGIYPVCDGFQYDPFTGDLVGYPVSGFLCSLLCSDGLCSVHVIPPLGAQRDHRDPLLFLTPDQSHSMLPVSMIRSGCVLSLVDTAALLLGHPESCHYTMRIYLPWGEILGMVSF